MRTIPRVSRELKTRVLKAVKSLSELGINPLTQGNVSLRDPSTGLIIITPHDFSYEDMTEDDLVVIDVHGKVKEGRRAPSAESPVHCVVYRSRPEVNGVVHSEPIYANAFGIIHREIPTVYVIMAIDVGGNVPMMPFAESGNEEFGFRMLKIMGKRRAVIWAGHGLLTVGETLDDAIHCTVSVERGAQIYHVGLCHGKPATIPQAIIETLIG